MSARIDIRPECPGDARTIVDIVKRAYADIDYSDHHEHLMINRLRGTNAFIPSLSLLATVDDEPAGHILLIKAHIRDKAAVTDTLALAPLSVAPEFQRRGVGKHLIDAAHRQAAGLGFASIVLVGVPDYYSRFGYMPLSQYPISLPFSAPEVNCMILALRPHALDLVTGMVEYPEGWLDH